MVEKRVDLSIIIVSYNTAKLTHDCLVSLVKFTHGISYELIVVDNASKDESLSLLSEFSRRSPLKLIANHTNLGFGSANNQGMKIAKGKYILLLNSDTVIGDNVLGEMVGWMEKNPKAGISTCALKNKDGSLQPPGGYFPTLFKVGAWMSFFDDLPLVSDLIRPYHLKPIRTVRQLDWITGAFFLIRREIIDNRGYFDEDYFMYVEEVDYCYRAKKQNWQVWYLPQWSILHWGGASGTSEGMIVSEFKSMKIYYQKNMPKWQTPIMKLFLRVGAMMRIIFFGKIYAKAYKAV